MDRHIASLLFLMTVVSPSVSAVEMSSPSGNLVAKVEVTADGRATWSLAQDRKVCIERSVLGIQIDGVDLGSGVALGAEKRSEMDERFAWRGGKSMATNRCSTYSLPVRHVASGTQWELEWRVFDDGVGYRYRVPGKGARRIGGERSSWTLGGLWSMKLASSVLAADVLKKP